MNYSFGELLIGDMFNTKAARWVKISTKNAICVMGSRGHHYIGQVLEFQEDDKNIVLLYSTVLRTEFNE